MRRRFGDMVNGAIKRFAGNELANQKAKCFLVRRLVLRIVLRIMKGLVTGTQVAKRLRQLEA
jgi:hypothetical protein